MKGELDFKPEDECIYCEDGGETKCKILEKEIKEKDGDKWLEMKFKVIQNLLPSALVGRMRRGHIFSAIKKIGVRVPFVLWEIREIRA